MTQMLERTYAAGAVIYREGEPSDAVYFIKDGEIEISRTTNGHRVLLGTLDTGDILGEMGVVLGNARSTTACAAKDSVLIRVSSRDFLATFGDANSFALPLLRMLCERLRKADRRLAEGNPTDRGAVLANVASVRLLPGSPAVQKQIGDNGIVIAQMPFTVGRRDVPGEPPRVTEAGLGLMIPDLLKLSPEHFAIEELNGRLVVRDLDSHLGTIVNGARISRHEASATAPLDCGENAIVAGAAESPYRFCVLIEGRPA
ncbi:MAG: cyclic nucleotide-binding domain-containing protein [Alphaproteobacteria bacterium]